jgi:hypothetical protein
VTALANAIEARASRLADRAHDAMYRDSFWEERFGERGRRFSQEDNGHHVSYLLQALRADAPDLLTGYARWLQGLLTTRGMCSRHIAENFGRLADAIRAEGVEDAGPAFTLLEAASAALIYDDGPARAVQVAAESIVEQAAGAVVQRHPGWTAELADPEGNDAGDEGNDSPAVIRNDLRYLLSYLADALANDRPDLFVQHIGWSDGFLARHGRPAGYLRASLIALDEALGPALGDAAATVGAIVQAGRAALASNDVSAG